MTPENFSYWLQWYCEICGDRPTEEQWKVITDHVKLAFLKVTPDRSKAAESIDENGVVWSTYPPNAEGILWPHEDIKYC